MSRNQIINPNSVQSQFASLVRDKDTLQKQSTNADRERRYEESQLQNLRSIQSSLSEKIRIAHVNEGVQSKKRQMLKKEMNRLKKVLEDDRNAIEELTSKVAKLEGENVEKKFQFVKEMDGFNDEMADALRMYEEKGLEKMLKSVDSCRTVEQFLRNKMQQPGFTQDQFWNSILHSINSIVGRLEHSIQHLNNEKSNYTSLCHKSQQLRKKVETKHSKSLGQMELDELESLWEQSNNDPGGSSSKDDIHSTRQHPVNMHLFYGNGVNGNTNNEPDTRNQDQDHDYAMKKNDIMEVDTRNSVESHDVRMSGYTGQ